MLLFAILPLSFYLIAFQSDTVFRSAWCFGFGYFGAGISWVHVSIADFGGLPLPASIALMVLLCAYLALFYGAIFAFLRKYFPPQIWPLAIMLSWLLMEWLRARVLSGFPWLSIAYSQTNSIFSSLFPLIGEIGLSALIVMVCMSLVVGIKHGKWLHASLPALVFATSALLLNNIQWTHANGESKSIALVQGNIAQSLRWDQAQDIITMRKYSELTQPLWGTDIIVWPEAAVPALESLVSDYITMLDERATEANTGFITGVVNYNAMTDVGYNSLLALGIDEDSNNVPYALNHSKRFSKHHLLPIGEFVPFEDILRPLAPIFDLPMSSFSRGEYVQDNLIAKNTYFAPAICFEIAFPLQIAANLTPQTDAIITVSNDAWFGDSHGPHQHLQIAQARALEFGLPVIRATNNGVTAIINHKGEIQGELPQFEAAVLQSTLYLVDGETPYRQFGDFPIWALALILFSAAIYLRHFRKA